MTQRWTTVQSEVNRADSAMADAAESLRKARELEVRAQEAIADAYRESAEALERMQRAQKLLEAHGPQHEVPWDGAW